jgi:hypothetical protein
VDVLSGVDPRVVEYLRKNKDKYDIDILKQELVRLGHPHEVVEAAEELLDEDVQHVEELPPFPDPFHSKDLPLEKNMNTVKKNQEKDLKKLDSVQIMLILLVVVLLGIFVYLLIL